MKEQELYTPVRNLFIEMGYDVKGEVKDVDLVAHNDIEDLTIMVEFKLQFNMKLIIQAINRQKMTNFVYIAIPRPDGKVLRNKSHKEKIHLLRRLELGLIYVTISDDYNYAQIIEEPRPYNRKPIQTRNKKKKDLLIKEMQSRHGDYNLGGSKGKIMTAYKEQALIVTNCLKDNAKKVSDVKALTGIDKSGAILSRNFYKWYRRVETGIYELTEEGQEALITYKKILEVLIYKP